MRGNSNGCIITRRYHPSAIVALQTRSIIKGIVPSSVINRLSTTVLSDIIFHSAMLEAINGTAIYGICTPIQRGNGALNLIIHRAGVTAQRSGNQCRSRDVGTNGRLCRVVPQNRFPCGSSIVDRHRVTHITSNFVVLAVSNIIQCTTPGTVDYFEHLNLLAAVPNRCLDRLNARLLGRGSPIPRALPLILANGTTISSRLSTGHSTISVHSLPLCSGGNHVKTVLLYHSIARLHHQRRRLRAGSTAVSRVRRHIGGGLRTISTLLELRTHGAGSSRIGGRLRRTRHHIRAVTVIRRKLDRATSRIISFSGMVTGLLHVTISLTAVGSRRVSVGCVNGFNVVPTRSTAPLSLILARLVAGSIRRKFRNHGSNRVAVSINHSNPGLGIIIRSSNSNLNSRRRNKLTHSSNSNLNARVVGAFIAGSFNNSIR